MGTLIREGKIRHWGVSNFRGWRIAEIVRLCDLAGVPRPIAGQPYYNAVNRMPEVEYLPLCAHHGIGVVPYSPLARGVLTGKYQPESASRSDDARRAQRQTHDDDRIPRGIDGHRADDQSTCGVAWTHGDRVCAQLGAGESDRQLGDRRTEHAGAFAELCQPRPTKVSTAEDEALARRSRRARPSVDARLHRSALSGDWAARSRCDESWLARLGKRRELRLSVRLPSGANSTCCSWARGSRSKLSAGAMFFGLHRGHRLRAGEKLALAWLRWRCPGLRRGHPQYAVPGPAASDLSGLAVDRHQAAAVGGGASRHGRQCRRLCHRDRARRYRVGATTAYRSGSGAWPEAVARFSASSFSSPLCGPCSPRWAASSS